MMRPTGGGRVSGRTLQAPATAPARPTRAAARAAPVFCPKRLPRPARPPPRPAPPSRSAHPLTATMMYALRLMKATIFSSSHTKNFTPHISHAATCGWGGGRATRTRRDTSRRASDGWLPRHEGATSRTKPPPAETPQHRPLKVCLLTFACSCTLRVFLSRYSSTSRTNWTTAMTKLPSAMEPRWNTSVRRSERSTGNAGMLAGCGGEGAEGGAAGMGSCAPGLTRGAGGRPSFATRRRSACPFSTFAPAPLPAPPAQKERHSPHPPLTAPGRRAPSRTTPPRPRPRCC